MAQTINNEKIIKTIIDQNESLKNLIIMLDASNLAPETEYIVTDLKSIREAFIVAEANTVHDLETIKTINERVTALRTKLISAGA